MIEVDISEYNTHIRNMIRKLKEEYESVENPDFLLEAGILAHDLPAKLKRALINFKLLENSAICIIRGFEIDDHKLGPTPDHWRNRDDLARSKEEDFYLVLCSHLLGESVAWATEQSGHLVHEVFPIKGNAGGQLGTSTDQLYWHTEDAFHPERMDYLGLLCMRNHDSVATTYASVDDINLPADVVELLMQPRYPIVPDEGNRADRGLSPDESGLEADIIRASHARVLEMYESPEPVAVLFGAQNDPYLRVHPYYIADFRDDLAATTAFEHLKTEINTNLKDIVLKQGDLLFIDNFKAVHGRKEIPGRYDGTDRWLKRGFVVRDLRKTRPLRLSAEARCVY